MNIGGVNPLFSDAPELHYCAVVFVLTYVAPEKTLGKIEPWQTMESHSHSSASPTASQKPVTDSLMWRLKKSASKRVGTFCGKINKDQDAGLVNKAVLQVALDDQ